MRTERDDSRKLSGISPRSLLHPKNISSNVGLLLSAATPDLRRGIPFLSHHPWFQIGKGVHQGCILSPYLFNLYAEYIMRNAELEEAQAGIKIAGRNINNLKYADPPPLRQKVKRN